MSLETIEHGTVNFAHAHPLLVKSALVVGGIAILALVARAGLQRIGVLDA